MCSKPAINSVGVAGTEFSSSQSTIQRNCFANNYVVTPIIVFIVLEPNLNNLPGEVYGMLRQRTVEQHLSTLVSLVLEY